MTELVSVEKCSSYEEEKVFLAVKKTIDNLGGMKKFVKPKQKILIKTNMVLPFDPENKRMPHPLIVKALIKLIKKEKAIPFVGDSAPVNSAQGVAKSIGLDKICAELKCEIVDLTGDAIQVKTKQAWQLHIAKKLDDFDAIINLCKMKTHALTGFTGAIKNLFGCVPGMAKLQMHFKIQDVNKFSEMLLELHHALQPRITLNLMDAVIAMQGHGPTNGTAKEVGLILASKNAIALDFIALNTISINPDKIPCLKLAKYDFKKIQVIGLKNYKNYIKDFHLPKEFPRKSSRLPPIFWAFAQKYLTSKPICIESKCISCGNCVKVCPVKAIQFNSRKKPEFDYEKCIRCYCCFELCPENAIHLKKGLIMKLFFRHERKKHCH